jgi:predicted ester cyclase
MLVGTRRTRRAQMSEANKELVRNYYRELNAGNYDAILEAFADPDRAGRVKRGTEVYAAAFPDMHLSVEELIAEGDKVFCRTILTGTHDGEIKGIAPTGRQVSVDNAEVYRIEDAKFVSYWCQLDVAGMTRQLTEERPVEAAAGAASG